MMKLPTLKGLNKNYKKHYRFHLKGEPAFLRGLNPTDQTDFTRYKKIYQDPRVEQYIEGSEKNASNKELRKILKEQNDLLVFVIANAEDKNRKMQGWIQFSPDETQRIRRIKDLKAATKQNNTIITEISFARYNPARKKVKGVISSGVRQACIKVKEMETLLAQKENRNPRKIIINAYVSKDNKPSVRVLNRAGFVRKGQFFYHNPKFKKYRDDEMVYYFRLDERKLRKQIRV